MKTLLCASALALAVGGFASAANAALVQWTLTDVTFVDGGTAANDALAELRQCVREHPSPRVRALHALTDIRLHDMLTW